MSRLKEKDSEQVGHHGTVLRARNQAEAARFVGRPGTIVIVGRASPKWCQFQCPCGCGDVVALNLRSEMGRHWRMEVGPTGAISLWPSVVRETGCRSHFVIHNGRFLFVRRKPPAKR